MPMECRQFRDALDCYLDAELSPEAMVAAEAHRRVCAACDRLAAQRAGLKAAVKRTVSTPAMPVTLDARVRRMLASAPRSQPWMSRSTVWRSVVAAAALIIMAVAVSPLRARVVAVAANTMDVWAVELEASSEVVVEGTVLCRDCELEHRHGVKATCPLIGHHGAIATADGRIWNIVEQEGTQPLIHDATLLGKRVVVRGRAFRGARALVVDGYDIVS